MTTDGPRHEHDLRLVLEGQQMDAKCFETGLTAFISILTDVAKAVTGGPRQLRWLVRVEAGSACAVFSPSPRTESAARVPAVVDTVIGGMAALERGTPPPHRYPESAVESTRKLAAIVSRTSGVEGIRVERGEFCHRITERTVDNIRTRRTAGSTDWGTVEGQLQTITAARNHLRFMVVDPLTRRSTECRFGEDLTSDVTKAFRRRVAVSGMIHYRADGEPVSIDVREFRVFPPDTELPRAADVRGVLREAM